MRPAFESPTETQHKQELLTLTNPDNITSGLPDTSGLHVPAELEARNLSSVQSSPNSGLHIAMPARTLGFANGQPPTPMPGTNLSLELDGCSSENLPVFERSVEPADGSPIKGSAVIKHMRSLDALAKSCEQRPKFEGSRDSTDDLAKAAAIAHRADEAAAEYCTNANGEGGEASTNPRDHAAISNIPRSSLQ